MDVDDDDSDVIVRLGSVHEMEDAVSGPATATGLGMETLISETTITQVCATQSSAFGED